MEKVKKFIKKYGPYILLFIILLIVYSNVDSQEQETNTGTNITELQLIDDSTQTQVNETNADTSTVTNVTIPAPDNEYAVLYPPDALVEETEDGWYIINDNKPYFLDSEITTDEFETYSNLDDLGRCGVAYANISLYTMPTEERGSISNVKPTGWHSNAPANWNRCHLIGFQLAGENANKLNLITGTRYLNVDLMLPFENMVADYVKETHNHVLYRVTPIFREDRLVADGLYMEAYSVEDNGDGIEFNVWCPNVAPGIKIDYLTGESYKIEG